MILQRPQKPPCYKTHKSCKILTRIRLRCYKKMFLFKSNSCKNLARIAFTCSESYKNAGVFQIANKNCIWCLQKFNACENHLNEKNCFLLKLWDIRGTTLPSRNPCLEHSDLTSSECFNTKLMDTFCGVFGYFRSSIDVAGITSERVSGRTSKGITSKCKTGITTKVKSCSFLMLKHWILNVIL